MPVPSKLVQIYSVLEREFMSAELALLGGDSRELECDDESRWRGDDHLDVDGRPRREPGRADNQRSRVVNG